MTDILDTIPRLTLADLPTPLHEAPRLAHHCALQRLLIKRDDMTGLAGGGNKARKLEYDLHPAASGAYDTLMTVGGRQSNHARMTAAAARILGLDVKLVLGGPVTEAVQGNMLLDALFGAEIRFLKENDDNDAMMSEMRRWEEELRNAGKRPFTVPLGGSTGRGALGYVRGMRELAQQFGGGAAQVVVTVGSCGTLAGCIVGAARYMPGARIVGISVSRSTAAVRSRTAELMRECAGLLGQTDAPDEESVEVYDGYFEEYGTITRAGREAIVTAARLEGLLLDPVYTGKAMAGLLDLVRLGVLRRDVPVIFLHTGGLPILFAYEEELRPLAQITYR